MVRLTVAALATLIVVGCTGLVDGEGGGLTPEQVAARKAFVDKAMPALGTCISCHNGSQDTETQKIGFVAGAEPLAIRETLIGYAPAVVNTDAPSSSRMLTKGVHAGPALVNSESSKILEWIQAEKDALPKDDTTQLETVPFVPLLCTQGLPGDPTCPINDVALDAIGAPGSKIRFVAQALGSGLYLNNLKLIQDPTMGAFIEHPLFVGWPAAGGAAKPDLIDRFFSVKMNLKMDATGEAQQIAGGTAAFVGFVASPDPNVADKITIHFKKVNVYQPDTLPPPGNAGCKVPASFEQNARNPLNTSCGNCHRGQNGGATSAMNLTGVNQPNAATPNAACNQTKLRVNTVDLNQSAIYLAVTPGNGNHPFNFDQAGLDAFKAAVNVWINAEKVAP